jgi:NitT/TauT family transport system ATP-binding protein
MDGIMHQIAFNSVRFNYGNQKILDDIRFIVEPGDFVCLLGPSGCGKSTLLRLTAGLDKPLSGSISIDGRTITGPGLDRGVVFQDYSLFPWLTASENIVLSLEQAYPGRKKRDLEDIAEQFLELVGLRGASKKLPKELSGGMKQRAAIALVFAINSPILLMDEPFGALDAITRANLQDLLLQLWHQNGSGRKTVLFVTHDVDEALLLANKIVILSLNPGRVRTVINVDIPRPRIRGNLYSNEAFRGVRAEVMGLLNESILTELDAGGIALPEGDRI